MKIANSEKCKQCACNICTADCSKVCKLDANECVFTPFGECEGFEHES